MKTQSIRIVLPLVVFLGALSACGGGGDDASGGPNELSVNPDEVIFTFVDDGIHCIGESELHTVLINGGAGDFRITSTLPNQVFTSQSVTANGVTKFSFVVSTEGCFEDMPIQVTDVRKNFASIRITAKAAASVASAASS